MHFKTFWGFSFHFSFTVLRKTKQNNLLIEQQNNKSGTSQIPKLAFLVILLTGAEYAAIVNYKYNTYTLVVDFRLKIYILIKHKTQK